MYHPSDEKKEVSELSLLFKVSYKCIKDLKESIVLPLNPIQIGNGLVLNVRISIFQTNNTNIIKKLVIDSKFNDIVDFNNNIHKLSIDPRKLFYISGSMPVDFSIKIDGLFSFGNVLIFGNDLYYKNKVFKPFYTHCAAMIEGNTIMSNFIKSDTNIYKPIWMSFYTYFEYDENSEYDLDILNSLHRYSVIYKIQYCSNDLIIMFYNQMGLNTDIEYIREQLLRITGNDIEKSVDWSNILQRHSNNIFMYI
jgi:hypothetical protein